MSELILDGHKLAWHPERVEAWLRGERIAPVTVDCALTRRCTYNCVYCYGRLQANPERLLTWGVVSRFIRDAASIGVKAVSFVSDGESTLNPCLYRAVLLAKELGLDVGLGTNGFLLKRESLDDILPALTYLRFNISAADPEVYARVHGVSPACFERVRETVAQCVRIKRRKALPVTLGLQMVLMPEFADQILPLARLGKELGVDYLVIKHCSDDEYGSLGVRYEEYFGLVGILREAEAFSSGEYRVIVKWSKILSGGKRTYSRCYGPPFILQLSGSGLVAPCGMLFNERYKRYHIGNIAERSFLEIWESDRYWEVMETLASPAFDARRMCGSLCLQHKVNQFLWALKRGEALLAPPRGAPPLHRNFV